MENEFIIVGIVLLVVGLVALAIVLDVRRKKHLDVIKNMSEVYPHGFTSLLGSYDDIALLDGVALKEVYKKCLSQEYEEIIRQEEQRIILEQEESEKRKREYESFKAWYHRQQSCASKSRELSPDKWGCYPYDIEIVGTDEGGEEKSYQFRIWQHFVDSFCRDESLDYTHFKGYKYNRDKLESFEKKRRYYKTFVYDEMLGIIKGLSDNVIVLFLDNDEPSDTIPYSCSLYEYHFGYLRDQLDNYGIRNWDTAYESFIVENQQDIVIVELITSNAHLKKVCKDLFEKYRANQPSITYISMLKEHTSKEMSALIHQKEKRIKEQEEQIKQEAERQVRITNALKEAVSSWAFVPNCDLHHAFLIRYYPTTCDFNATDEEWHNRQLIWGFKNDPGKTTRIPHNEAVDEIVPPIESFFKSTFGGNLSNLTLVCIPASSPEKNKARYEEFSEIFCRRTGMANAYSHISVNAERTPRRLGGAVGSVDNISFDESFFKDKNVLLFDDVMTGGNSMRAFQRKLTSFGANVIAGFTIGRTFHTRENEHNDIVYEDLDFMPF